MNTRYLLCLPHFFLTKSFTSDCTDLSLPLLNLFLCMLLFLCHCEWHNFPYFFVRCFTVSVKRCNYFFCWFYILQLYLIHWLALRVFCWVWGFLYIKWYHLQITPPPHSSTLFCIFLYIWSSQNVLSLLILWCCCLWCFHCRLNNSP